MIDMMMRNEDGAKVRDWQAGRPHLSLYAITGVEQIDGIANDQRVRRL